MTEFRKSLIADLILGVLAVMLVFSINAGRELTLIHKLCDGFFVAAVILLGSGGIGFVNNRGGLDLFGYGFKSIYDLVTNSGRLGGPDEDYVTYCQRKATERKPFAHLLVAGGIYLVLAVICLILYSMM